MGQCSLTFIWPYPFCLTIILHYPVFHQFFFFTLVFTKITAICHTFVTLFVLICINVYRSLPLSLVLLTIQSLRKISKHITLSVEKNSTDTLCLERKLSLILGNYTNLTGNQISANLYVLEDLLRVGQCVFCFMCFEFVIISASINHSLFLCSLQSINLCSVYSLVVVWHDSTEIYDSEAESTLLGGSCTSTIILAKKLNILLQELNEGG